MTKLRLGVNIDHVATVHNARGGDNPGLVRAVKLVQRAGANKLPPHMRNIPGVKPGSRGLA